VGLLRRVQFYTTGGAIAASLGLTAQDCAVSSSSEDCVQRAVCPDVNASPDDADMTALDARGGSADREAGGAPRDGIGGDAALESAPGDARSEEATPSDAATSEAMADARSDVESKDATGDTMGDRTGEAMASGDAAADASMSDGTGDGCVDVGPEDCSNGVDDDCNGKIDCADPACGAYVCAPPAPSGWFGPVGLWQGAFGSTAPGCPTLYQWLMDAFAGLSGPPASCSCSCAASGQTCSAIGTFHPDQTCTNATCATVTPAPAGGCTPVPSNSCGSGGSFEVAGTPAPSGGSCSAQVTPTIPPLGWMASARVCSYAGSPDSPGGCTEATTQCVAAPTSPYATNVCIYSAADPPPTSCPAGYSANPPTVIYAGSTDTRGCGSCTCSGPSGGACSGSITLYGGAACTGNAGSATYALGTVCQGYGGLAPVPGSVKASYTVASGTCSVQAQPLPTGSAAPTGPTTVCCL
jgi:hypothetical protein